MISPYNQILYNISNSTTVVEEFVSSVSPPIFYESGAAHQGFRFLNPTAKHFCILKAVRAISGLNAGLILAKYGFNQELCVVIRTIIECNSQIAFILTGMSDQHELTLKQEKLLAEFFDDFRRNQVSNFKGPHLKQQELHQVVGRAMDESLKTLEGGEKFSEIVTETLLSNTYLTFSNYVHSRYPEIMDLYGGIPERFHLRGMQGTPKDYESIDILQSYSEAVSNEIRNMIYKFSMVDKFRSNSSVMEWLVGAKNSEI